MTTQSMTTPMFLLLFTVAQSLKIQIQEDSKITSASSSPAYIDATFANSEGKKLEVQGAGTTKWNGVFVCTANYEGCCLWTSETYGGGLRIYGGQNNRQCMDQRGCCRVYCVDMTLGSCMLPTTGWFQDPALNGNLFGVHTDSRFAGILPNPTLIDLSAPPPDSAGGRGDPHMTNIKGEKFNINRQGYAPLVSITSDGASHLEVMALIEGVKKCQKKMFITQVNSSGNWLEKTVAVSVGDQTDSKAFRVIVDGQEIWSPLSQGYQPPATVNMVFDHPDKFSIHELSNKFTPAEQPGMELKTAHDLKLRIVRPLHRPTAPPHLNFDIHGLKKLSSSSALSVGGLLGEDDHSQWSFRDQACGTNFERGTADATTSIASAQ